MHFAKTHKAETVRDTMPLTRLTPDQASLLYDQQISMFSDDGRFPPKAVAVIKNAAKELGHLDKLPPDNVLYTEAFLPGARSRALSAAASRQGFYRCCRRGI